MDINLINYDEQGNLITATVLKNVVLKSAGPAQSEFKRIHQVYALSRGIKILHYTKRLDVTLTLKFDDMDFGA